MYMRCVSTYTYKDVHVVSRYIKIPASVIIPLQLLRLNMVRFLSFGKGLQGQAGKVEGGKHTRKTDIRSFPVFPVEHTRYSQLLKVKQHTTVDWIVKTS